MSTEQNHPPIVELVLGAQFSPLTNLSAGHFGRIWSHLGEAWKTPSDAPLLDDQFELFDRPRWSQTGSKMIKFSPVRLPARFMLENDDRLLQIQSTRFHMNWKRKEEAYPSYKQLIEEFDASFNLFGAWIDANNLGPINLNQWELTTIDAFPIGKYWSTPADWSKVLPGLFSDLFPREKLPIELENREAEWCFIIGEKKGRLYISASSGLWGEQRENALILSMTARGPIGEDGVSTFREGLDLGYGVALETFKRVVNSDVLERCGLRK